MGKTYERILLIHRKAYTYIHSNGIQRKVYTYIHTATAGNTFRDVHHPRPAEGCISQPHKGRFHTHPKQLKFRMKQNKDNGESFPRLRVTKLKPHTSWVFILHTCCLSTKGSSLVRSQKATLDTHSQKYPHSHILPRNKSQTPIHSGVNGSKTPFLGVLEKDNTHLWEQSSVPIVLCKG